VLSLNPALAGAGLTYSTGVLAVGQGFGIVVTADAIAVDVTAGYTWTGQHTFKLTTISHTIYPESTDLYDLGLASRWWRQQFVSQINAAVFAEQTIQLLGGWFMIPKDAGVMGALPPTALQVELHKAVTPGSYILIRGHDKSGAVKIEYLQVGTLVSNTTYNVTRDLAGLYPLPQNQVDWPDGTPYAVLGSNGDGRIELNAYDTPRISIIKQGPNYSDQIELIRLGDINGMGTVSTQTWGIYIGNNSQYLKYDGTTLTIAGNGSGVTNIDGGNITTGTIDAARITAVSLAAVRANIATLSALRADLGNVTAGSIVVGDASNKLWLNDSNDHGLAIGGLTKGSAPFSVAADGTFNATKATIKGSLSTSDGAVSIASGITFTAPTSFSSASAVLWKNASSNLSYMFTFGGGASYVHSEWCSNGAASYVDTGYVENVDAYNTLSAIVKGTVVKTAMVQLYAKAIDTVTPQIRSASVQISASASATAFSVTAGSIAFNASSTTGTGSVSWSSGLFSINMPANAVGTTQGNVNTLQVFQSTAEKDAFMTFHISNDYAVHFGLDGATNDLFVGGFSMGAVKRRIWHDGNHAVGVAGAWWSKVGYIDSAGVLEVGRYIDFHNSHTGTEDYSVRLQTDGGTSNLSINGSAIWHGGNFAPGNYAAMSVNNVFGASQTFAGGLSATSLNTYGSGGQVVVASRSGNADFVVYNTSNVFRIWYGADKVTVDTNGNLGAVGTVTAGAYLVAANGSGSITIGPQNAGWCHFSTDRAAFYMDHQLCVNGNFYNYNGDFTLGRGTNGSMTNRMTFYTWGTYVNQHFTIEDVFAMVNVQANQPNQPASGCKIYVWATGGVTYLQARFANGTIRNICNS